MPTSCCKTPELVPVVGSFCMGVLVLALGHTPYSTCELDCSSVTHEMMALWGVAPGLTCSNDITGALVSVAVTALVGWAVFIQ